MNIGPVVVRKSAFDELGGFNTSYSEPGQLGIGFDHELIGRLWLAGWQAAVMCPSRATAFRNGCGGKGSAVDLLKRKAQMAANRAKYTQQFQSRAAEIEQAVSNAQESLMFNATLLGKLSKVVRNCIDCEAGGDSLSALKERSLGFAEACPTADAKDIVY